MQNVLLVFFMGKRDVGNVLEIMRNDFRSAHSNPIVIITLIAIIIIPSLYAVINIDACWDPYEKTGDIDFAIANLDNGTTYEDLQLNIGNDLVDGLKNDTKFHWVFVDEATLREGVRNGTYYAGIVIPQNLSENVISITTDDPQSAKLIYIVNDKTNPVAPRIAQQGANAIYNEMNAKIIEFINLAAYGKLGELQSGLASGSSQLSSGAVQLSSGAAQVSSGAAQVANGESKVADGASQINDGANQLSKGAGQVSQGWTMAEDKIAQVADGESQVADGAAQITDGASQLSGGAEQVATGWSTVQDKVSQAESKINISQQDIDKLPDGKVKDTVNTLIGYKNSADQLIQGTNDVAQGSLKLSLSSAQLAEGSTELAKGSLSLAAGAELLSNAAAYALITAASSLSGAANSLAGVTGINETILGEYFYSPITLEHIDEYPVDHYGDQVAPFYIVLSMWVGALITCAMVSPGTSTGTKYSPLEMYFGKLALYLVISVFQSIVTIILCLAIGISVDNMIVFILSSIFISIVFMTLMYSFVSALGQVGKVLGILLLVFQISGTGGVYPIEIMNPIFQALYPYLPMTYAINILRESLLGLIWSNYISSFVVLLGIVIATVIVSLIIKEKADKLSHYFEDKLDESKLFW